MKSGINDNPRPNNNPYFLKGDTVMPMPKKSDTKSIPSGCEEKAVQPVAEREFTIAGKSCKISMKIVICPLILCLSFSVGFILSELSYMTRHQINDVHLNRTTCRTINKFHQHVYVFDTEQKLEDYYKTMESVFPPGFPRTSDMMALVGRDQPLVAAGPFVIFVNDESGEFSVRDSQSLMQIVVWKNLGWTRGEQSKHLILSSSIEKGWIMPRFSTGLRYSEDGVYEGGWFAFDRENGLPDRTYYDSKGSGVIDKMSVYEYDVGMPDKFVMPTTYRLNGLTWERDEGPLPVLPLPPGTMPPETMPLPPMSGIW